MSELIPRVDKNVNSIFFRYPYGVQIKKIKVEGNIEVDITLVVTIEVVSPETTLFRIQPTGNWLGIVVAKVNEATRGYAGGEKVTIEKLRKLAATAREKKGVTAKEEDGTEHLITQIMKMNGEPEEVASDIDTRRPIYGEETPDGNLHLCGVKIISVEFQNWEFSDPEIVGKAFQAEEVELRTAKGRMEKAKGDAFYASEVGNAEAEVLSNKWDAVGPQVLEAEVLAGGIRDFTGQVLTLGVRGPLTNYQVGQLPPRGQTPPVVKPRGYQRPVKNRTPPVGPTNLPPNPPIPPPPVNP